MTPAQERALIEATERGFTDILQASFQEVRDKILAGQEPRLVVEQALASFSGQYADLLREAFGAILAQSVSRQEVLDLTIGGLKLSQKLYLMGVGVSEDVKNVVERHLRGFQEGRSLAFQIFEGYGFNEREPLVFNPLNEKLPRYLRDLLRDVETKDDIAEAFARIQVSGLSTPALRAAYNELLDALDEVRDGKGAEYLARKISTAFYERMRYFAARIAATELHRAYMLERLKDLQQDPAEYVRFELSSGHPQTDICDLFARQDAFGKGAGIYPKDLVPIPPLHPWCLCTITPRPSITGDPKPNEESERNFLQSLEPREAARVAGSYAKLDQALAGQSMLSVHNAKIDPLYRVKLARDYAF